MTGNLWALYWRVGCVLVFWWKHDWTAWNETCMRGGTSTPVIPSVWISLVSYWVFVAGYGIFMSPRSAQSGSLSSCTGSKINSLNSKMAQLPTLMSTQYYLWYLPHSRFFLSFLDKWDLFLHNGKKRLLYIILEILDQLYAQLSLSIAPTFRF